ncbi:MAG: BMC domain-containing protein [Clostridia bacterium]|nr:BMC domain-containing protein [Clostridia bacterium]
MKSIGLVEVQSVTAAVDCLDLMCKAAEVNFVTWERKLGGRLVTIIVEGQISAVKAAVEAAEAGAIIKPAATAVIASPHSETQRMVKLSASRLTKKAKTEKKAETQEYIKEV